MMDDWFIVSLTIGSMVGGATGAWLTWLRLERRARRKEDEEWLAMIAREKAETKNRRPIAS